MQIVAVELEIEGLGEQDFFEMVHLHICSRFRIPTSAFCGLLTYYQMSITLSGCCELEVTGRLKTEISSTGSARYVKDRNLL